MPDRVLVAVSKDGTLRARAATLPGVFKEACERHHADAMTRAAFARALGVAAVFPVDWKDTERLSLHFAGRGPLGAIFVDHRDAGDLRVMRKAPDGDPPTPRGDGGDLGLLPDATLTVTEQTPSGAYNQGQVALQHGAIDLDVEDWFNLSQQTPTVLRARGDVDGANSPGFCSALLLQTLGGASPDVLPTAALMDGLDHDQAPEALLEAAFGTRAFEILEERSLRYHCPCSRERIAASIALLDEQELLSMIQEDEGAQTRCEFCGETYSFDSKDLCSIYDAKQAASQES